MTPKKAIIIVLSLFLIIAIIFVVLYINKTVTKTNQPADNGYNTSASSTSQENLSPAQQKIKALETKTNQQVEKIIEQGKTATGGITVDAQSKIEEAENQEIMEKIKLKTPEELKADQERRVELEKAEQEINRQIKEKLENK